MGLFFLRKTRHQDKKDTQMTILTILGILGFAFFAEFFSSQVGKNSTIFLEILIFSIMNFPNIGNIPIIFSRQFSIILSRL